MDLAYRTVTLPLAAPFRISRSTDVEVDLVWVELTVAGVTGYGEATPQEHYGESVYLMAMAWHYTGKTDAALRTAADTLLGRMRSAGTVPHVRSFNWQCRSAIAGAWFLR